MICYPLLGRNGEFGNQLFQIAATLSHAKDNNTDAVFPVWNYRNLFKAKLNYNFNQADIRNKYSEKNLYYDPIPNLPDLALYGYFQSEKYFKHNSEYIRHYFTFLDDLETHVKNKYTFLDNDDTVGVHLRTYSRGSIDPRHIHADVLENIAYLKQAFNYYGRNKKFIVCSDNIAKAEQILGSNPNLTFIRNEDLITDFVILKNCRNHINSASSFSWWASWLNGNKDKKITVPQKWFNVTLEQDSWYNPKDIVPEDWIKLG